MKTLAHLLGALRLDEDALYEIAFDRRESWPALLIFSLSCLAGGAGWILSAPNVPFALGIWLGNSLLTLGLLGEVAHFMAMLMFGGGVRRDEVRRLAGFAMPPLALALALVQTGIPFVGVLVAFWSLAILYRGMHTYFAMGTARTLTLVVFATGAAFVFWGLANTVFYAAANPD